MKIFLDCGTNLGQGLNEFHKKFNLFNNPAWHIYTFEPNPDINLDNMFLNVKNITKIQKAVWIENTILDFRKQGHDKDNLKGLGSKIECVEKKYNPSNCLFEIQAVEAINFSEFLIKINKKYNNPEIFVKMDIEGAEFEVLEYLINKKTIGLIKEIFCECHARFRFPLEQQNNYKIKDKIFDIENNLKNKVEKYGITFHFWN